MLSHVFRRQDIGILTAKHSWHADLHRSLSKLGTPTKLIDSLTRGVGWWLLTDESTAPRAMTYGSVLPQDILITSAYCELTQLGWDQLMHGCMSSCWGRAYVYITKSSSLIQDAQKWEKQVIQLLWNLSLNIWNYRNKDLHGHDTADALARCTSALHDQVEALHTAFQTDPHIVSYNDQYLFDKSSGERCSNSNQDIQNWLRSVDIAMTTQATHQDKLRQQASKIFRRNPSPSPLINWEAQSYQSVSTPPSTISKEQ